MGWYDEGESGPPTMEDDAWYTHAVVSLGYPKVKRGGMPMKGQEKLWGEEPTLYVTDQMEKLANEARTVVEPWGPGTAPQIRSWAEEHQVHVHDVIEGCWCGEAHEEPE